MTRSISKPRRPSGRLVAVISDNCTGCGGTPICWVFCKNQALVWSGYHEDHPLRMMSVDPARCSGCGACVTRGPLGTRLTGCPWDAIDLKPVSPAAAPDRTD